MQYRKLTAVDLFSGLGGFRIAGQQHGCDFIFACDNDPDAQRTYRTNFGETPQGDITRFHAAKIPSHDVLCAGFPCTSFSLSGKREGFDDPRGRLFFEIVRIAEYHQPAVLFLENVKNLVAHDDGRTLASIVSALEGLGYDVFWKILNASHFGVPTKRERVYIVGIRRDLGVSSFEFPQPTMVDVILADFLDPEVGERYDIVRDDVIVGFPPPPCERYPKPVQIGQFGKGGQGYRIYSPQGHAITFASQTGGAAGKTGAYFIDGRVRSLSPDEGLQVMGFPSDYRIPLSDAKAYRLIGNSIAVPVVEAIFDAIAAQVFYRVSTDLAA